MTPPQVVFLVGSPRSGTTWLQHLLGAHPRIATPQETNLVSRYVAPWLAAWDRQRPGPWNRHQGLGAILTHEEFLALVRSFVLEVYGAVLRRKPGATVVLDKNPDHALVLAEALAVLPEARVVHLLRDGRDVACSLADAARREWGRAWAPTHVDGAAERWDRHVRTARSSRGLTGSYAEARYEELRSDRGPEVLSDLYERCGLDPDPALARRSLELFDAGRVRSLSAAQQPSSIVWGGEVLAAHGGNPPEVEGFLGESRAGVWRERFSPYDRWLFDRVAGDLLVELGYEPDRSWVGVGAAGRAGARSRHAAARTAYRVRRLLPG